MKNATGTPIRIQKAGAASPSHHHSASHDSDLNHPDHVGDKTPASDAEPKVEVREIQSGIFEITVTCRCGHKSMVRCESIGATSA